MLSYPCSNRLAAFGLRFLAAVSIVVLVVTLALYMEGTRTAGAQSASCEPIDLGILGAQADAELRMDGRWTTKDCDSRFLTDSDALYYRFRLAEDGQVRIELSSADGDSYLHLLAEDGSVITHDDDTGPGLDARIERDLTAGVYLIEASEGAGRVRGPSDFTISVQRATGCQTVDLGPLVTGDGLKVESAWTLDDCGARFRENTPAHTYAFQLPQEGLIRIDLTALEGGDPYLYLLSSDGTYLYSDDDGGAGRNSRIENDLAPGTYLVEATTYGNREHAHELTDFELTIRLVDSDGFHIKAEAIRIPDQVVAGEPLTVHYRVGNPGRTDLPQGHSVRLILVSRGLYRRTDLISASNGLWMAGVSHHTGEEAAIPASTTTNELRPFEEVSFRRPGLSWAFLAAITYDEEGEEVDFHGLWRDFLVLDGFTFDPVTVKVNGMDYRVSTESDDEGMVTVSVTAVDDPQAEVAASTRAMAIYAAGVQTQMLDGVFQRPSIDSLEATERSESVNVADPSSDTLLKLFTDQYVDAVSTSRLTETLAAGEVVNPVKLEDLLLDIAETASARYASQAAFWTALQEQVQRGNPISPQQAFTFQSQLVYAERVLSPMVAAGEAVLASRATDLGWNAPEVQAMAAELEKLASCGAGAPALRLALDESANAGALLQLDSEARVALPVYGLAVDAVLCAVPDADNVSSRFLRTLSISNDREIQSLFGQEQPPAPVTPPHLLRILAKLGDDDRIELGVELSGGQQVLPIMRYLPADSPIDEWSVSTDVEAGEGTIGRIRARRLADGRMELGFLSADGEAISPDIRFLPADMPAGVWLRTSVIQVPQAAVLQGGD